ncbi:MAG: hypothetical protein ACLFP9_05650 [Desulfonatronovibrio sp.]
MAEVKKRYINRKSACSWAGALMFLVLFSCPAYTELLAPVYPGGIMLEHDQKGAVFLIRDDIDLVLEYYRNRLGDPEEFRQDGMSGQGRRYHWRIAEHQAGTGKVQISTQRPANYDAVPDPSLLPPDMSGAYQICLTHKLLEPLVQMAMRLPDRDGSDFVQACQRYVHLTWSFFQDTDELDRHGRRMGMDEYLLSRHKHSKRPLSPDSMHEAYAKMQELALSGRTEEARKMAQQMQNAFTRNEDWEEWIRLLEDINEHAFQTKVMINTHPSTWTEWEHDKG